MYVGVGAAIQPHADEGKLKHTYVRIYIIKDLKFLQRGKAGN